MAESSSPAVVAAVDGGTFYHQEALRGPRYRHLFDRLIYAPRLERTCLAGIDTLVVTCRTSSVLLGRSAPMLRDFLDRGGTLVAMGECGLSEWLTEVRTIPGSANFWWWLDPDATLGLTTEVPDHGVFDHITLADATWHYHGALIGPAGATRVIDCRDGGAILIDDDRTWPGRLIATTLDPFYHHGSRFMPAATRFLDGFLPWLRAGAPHKAGRGGGPGT